MGTGVFGPVDNRTVSCSFGAVGHFAVQLAKLTGATVYGTSGTAKLPFVLGLGATDQSAQRSISGRTRVRRYAR